MTLTIYCKSHRRRPIRLQQPVFLTDAQADIPLAWCSRCGCEVFCRGQTQCDQCRGEKGES